MSRRSTPKKVIDERAFPVRVKIAVPPLGFGRLGAEMATWLQANLGGRDYAQHPSETIGGCAVAFYFRDIEVAGKFVREFPQAELADATGEANRSA